VGDWFNQGYLPDNADDRLPDLELCRLIFDLVGLSDRLRSRPRSNQLPVYLWRLFEVSLVCLFFVSISLQMYASTGRSRKGIEHRAICSIKHLQEYFLLRVCSHKSLAAFPKRENLLDADIIPGMICKKE
jgi:hypothetical protein